MGDSEDAATVLDNPSPPPRTTTRMLLLDVLGNLHCLSFPAAELLWSTALVRTSSCRAGSPAAREDTKGLYQCTSSYPGVASPASSMKEFSPDVSGSGTASPGPTTTTASTATSTTVMVSPLTSHSSGSSSLPSAASHGEKGAGGEGRPTAPASLLSGDKWFPVLSAFATEGNDPEDEASDDAALRRQPRWQWGLGDQSTPLKDAVKRWNRHCCAGQRVLTTEEHTERFAEVDAATGVIRWQDSEVADVDGEEQGEERAASLPDTSPSPSFSSSALPHATLSLLLSTTITTLSHPATDPRRWREGRPRASAGTAAAPRLWLTSTVVSSVSLHDNGGRGTTDGDVHVQGGADTYMLRCGADGRVCSLSRFTDGRQGDVNHLLRPSAATEVSVVAACLVDLAAHRVSRLPLCRQVPETARAVLPTPPASLSWYLTLSAPSLTGVPVILCEYRALESRGMKQGRRLGSDRNLGGEHPPPHSLAIDVDQPLHPASIASTPAASSSSSSLTASTSADLSDPSSDDVEARFARWREEVDGNKEEVEEQDDRDASQTGSSTISDDDVGEDKDRNRTDDDVAESIHGCDKPSSAAEPFSSRSASGELVVVRQRSHCSQPEFAPAQPFNYTPPHSPDYSSHSSMVDGSPQSPPLSSFFDENFDPLLLLGRGATGAALLVRHRVTGAFYAVKVLLARDYESEREILREVRLHAMLDHKHLVRYYACWSELVTPQRAQQLAFVGLAKRRELIVAAPESRHAAANVRARFPPTVPRSMITRSQNNSRRSLYNSHTPTPRPAGHRGMLRVLSAAGWGNLKLDLADMNMGHPNNGRTLLVGEDSLTSGTGESTHGWSESTRRTGHSKGSFWDRVERIGSSSSDHSSSSSTTTATTSSGEEGTVHRHHQLPSKRYPAHNHSHRHGTRPRRKPAESIIGSRVVFLQMEFCQRTLAQHLAAREGIDRIENLVIVLQLLDGLHYLHKAGVLHRDIKPTNIFLDFRCQLVQDHDTSESEEDDGDSDSTTSRESDSSTSSDNSGAPAEVASDRVTYIGSESNDEDDDDASVAADYEAIYTGGCSPTPQDRQQVCTALATVSPWPSAVSALRTASCPSSCANGTRSTCFLAEGQGELAHLSSSHNALFPTSSPASHTAAHRDAHHFASSADDDDDGQATEQHRAAALQFYQEQILAMLMNTPHCGGGEFLRRHLASRASQHKGWTARHSRKGSSCAGDAGAAERMGMGRGRRRDATVRRATRWLLRHLLQVHLGDFGLAKVVSPQHFDMRESSGGGGGNSVVQDGHTTGVGSPLYASPEQFRGGERITVASDAFSVGVVMAEMYIQPQTIAERLHVLRAVRDGRFPTKEDIAEYPELSVARKLARTPVGKRVRLDKARSLLKRMLMDCVAAQMDACQ